MRSTSRIWFSVSTGMSAPGTKTAAPISPFCREKRSDQLVDDRLAQHRQARRERRRRLAEPPRERARDLVDREARARPARDDVGREHVRHVERLGAGLDARRSARCARVAARSSRSSSSVGAPPSTYTSAAASSTGRRDAHRRRRAAARELLREQRRERAARRRAAACPRPRSAAPRRAPDDRSGPSFVAISAPAGGRRGRARGSPGGRRSRRRFAIIDEPPTETNGSGMPVIGAIPIVMPTLTKIWNRNANTIPPATIAAERVARDGDDLQPAPDDEQVEQRAGAPRRRSRAARRARRTTKSVACSGR